MSPVLNGLKTEVQNGVDEWRRLIREAGYYLNPTINKGTPEDSFMLQAVDEVGIPHAVIAMRIMEGDLCSLVYSGKYFGLEDNPPVTLPLPRQYWVSGTIGVMGGLYVWPEYRNSGLGPEIAREARREAFRRGCDFVGGYMLHPLFSANMWKKYGHERAEKVMDEFWFEGANLGALYLTLGALECGEKLLR